MIASNQSFQKSANIALVLDSIRKAGMISRVDIARALGLKKSTVTNIISELLDFGIVEILHQGDASPLGGRKPVNLGLKSNFGQILGLSLHPWFYDVVISDLNGNVLDQYRIKLEEKCTDLFKLCKEIDEHVKHRLQAENGPLIGVGIGLPGYVDLTHGVIIKSWSFDIENFDLGRKLNDIFHVPVIVDNDSNCCAAVELFRDDEEEDFIYVLSRLPREEEKMNTQGIGMGLVINGKLYYGSSFASGEFHSYHWKNPEISQLAYSDALNPELRKNDETLRQYIVELLENISVVVSVVNPKKVIFGYDISVYQEIVKDVLANELKDSWITQYESNCEILFTNLGEFEVAHGAAGKFLLDLFSIPQVGKNPDFFNISWEEIFHNYTE